MTSLYQLSATELKEKLEAKEISSVEILQDLIQHRKKHLHLKAFLDFWSDQALEKAKKSDHKRSKSKGIGVLEGIPVAIKDNICVKGALTTCASRMLSNYISPYDAYIIQKLKAEGAILLGKTNMDEFSMGSSCENSSRFPTRNPWNPDYVPGGSSGGSAVAVATSMVPLALGSDTGGSVRQPAALSGVVGLKPTYGRVSRHGLVAFAGSLDQIGTMSRTIEDNALLLEAIAGHDPQDSTSVKFEVSLYRENINKSIKGIRIGVPKEYFSSGDKEILQSCQKAIEDIQRLGAECVEISLPSTQYAVSTYYLISNAEASSYLARYDGVHYGHRSSKVSSLEDVYFLSRSEGFGEEVKRRILLGTYILSKGYYEDYYLKALKLRTLMQARNGKSI